MRAIRGNEIAMIFQDPMTALNPVLTIGKQMAEILMRNKGLSKKAAKAAAIVMLEQVGIAEAERPIRPVSPRVQRRDAPEGDDRDCALLQSEASYCR
ncbi:oligopeptide/dipeptide ABC transporter ATPase [Enterobacter asburiae]|uniref:Oligopeptide/dipeptide ABC transporter ATPase n=1 Tax=Enterobacter asburiae TaxID=61645 RepID=A0A376FF00_ENTAS|nr:oligopeptide/dipeptide ABC transporter ATPase [Enterobacter asburiae]